MTDRAELRLEVLVEERSAEHALKALLPKIIPGVPFQIRVFSGKDRLLNELPNRLRGYAARLVWEHIKIVILVDRDDDDCAKLKATLEKLAADAGLATLTSMPSSPIVLNRIVIEELEAWFLGDVPALCAAYPKVPASLGSQAAFRDPDAVPGGTWQALERVLRKHGYHRTGLPKLAVATDVAWHMDVERNRSTSFQVFRDGLRRLVSEGSNAEAN